MQLEAERCKIAAERVHHREEVRRLQHEIEALGGSPQSFSATNASAYQESDGVSVLGHRMSSSAGTGRRTVANRHHTGNRGMNWLIDFIFPLGATAATVSSYRKDRSAKIIHV